MEFTIRPFAAADEPCVVVLWRECGLVVPWNDPSRDISRKMGVQPELFLVGELGQVLVATVMAGYEGHRGWVNYLAVSPEHRRRGIGKRMMLAVEQRLFALGCPKLNLQVRDTNSTVLAFYEQLGYRIDPVVSLGKRLISDQEPGTRSEGPRNAI